MKLKISILIFYISLIGTGYSTEYIDSLRVKWIVHKDKLDTHALNAISDLTRMYVSMDLDTARYWGEKYMALAKKIGDSNHYAQSYYLLGSVELSSGFNKKADSLYLTGLELTKGKVNRINVLLKNMLAMSNIMNSNYEDALVYLNWSLEEGKKLNDTSLLANTAFYLALSYEYQEKFDLSINFNKKTIRYKKSLNDKMGVANAMNNLSTVYNKTGQNDSAIKYVELALDIYKEFDQKVKVATCLANKAGFLKDKDEIPQAYSQFRQTINYCKQHNIQAGSVLSHLHFGLADAAFKLNKINEALLNYNLSEELFQHQGAIEQLASVYSAKSAIFKHIGIKDSALFYTEKTLWARDSLFRQNKQGLIEEMQAKFEVNEIKKEVSLLSKEKQIQSLTIKRQKLLRNMLIAMGLLITFFFVSVFKRYRLKKKANLELNKQKNIIEKQKEQIVDSISYASQIQSAFLVDEENLKEKFKDAFIYFKPRDIVSGDFYWVHHLENKTIIAACDCTGHGVPGAFMSMMGNSLLNEIVVTRGIHKASSIMEALHKGVCEGLKTQSSKLRDGMDMSLCVIDHTSNTLDFAGAKNDIYISRNGELIELRADYKSIGGARLRREDDDNRTFSSVEFTLQKGDKIYLFSDGYMNQFGGENRKKLGKKALRNILTRIENFTMRSQKEKIELAMKDWMREYEQLDDQMLIGVEV